MTTIAICDDEIITLLALQNKIADYLKNIKIEHTITTFASGEALLNSDTVFDIVFLDIKLNDISGINVARRFRNTGKTSAIVFITGYAEYVFEAFDVDAVNYLVKPIDEHKLFAVLKKVCLKVENEASEYLVVKKGISYEKIRLLDIMFFEAVDHKISLHTLTGIIDYYDKIAELEKNLPADFYRCHRSYIVNLRHIKKFDRNIIFFNNGETALVSKRKYDEFSLAYMHFIKRDGGLL